MNENVHNLSLQQSVFNQFMSEIRDSDIESDRLRFRRNLERSGEIIAYEISKTLEYVTRTVTTPLGECTCSVLADLSTGLRFRQEGVESQ